MWKGKPNVTKEQINFLQCVSLWLSVFFGILANSITSKEEKNYLKCTYRLDGRAGQVNFWLEGHPSAYYPVRPDQTQSTNISPLSVEDFEISVST